MKRHLLFIYLCLVSFLSLAQAGEWVWLNGDSAGNNPGSFGTQGIPSPFSQPPSFYEPCEWTDLNGNFWIYGGVDVNFNTYGDLWKYDPLTNEWTWVTGLGIKNDFGNYGTQGIPSPSNRPPARGWGQASWVDMNGNLWMFGGSNSTGFKYEDLWMYNIITNEWTWMKGPGGGGGFGTYGTLRVPDPANQPPTRDETSVTWTLPDGGAGDLWLFGGAYQYLTTLNDLWRFNIATNTWTWMNGSNLINQSGTYGTLGVEDSLNTPSGRRVYCKWKDNNDNLWLFGGWDDYNDIYYNDLWRYNPVTNKWAWMNGSSTGNVNGFYGTQCVMSPDNSPGRRYEDRVSWTDKDGNFWMYGGGHDYFYNNVWDEAWNDLWKYCVTANKWIWVSGDTVPNPTANWGAMGVSSPANKPVPLAGGIGWYGRDLSGNDLLYTFGGSDSSMLFYNTIWKYTVDSLCGDCNAVLPAAAFLSSDTAICAYDCVNFTDLSTHAKSWKWTFPGGIPSSSTDANPQNICYQNGGNYDVTLIAYNSGFSDSLTISNYIKVYLPPPTPVISQFHNDTLFCTTDTSYTGYQWYLNDTIITGATDTFLVISKSGNYNISVMNKYGCAIAVGINVVLGIYSYDKGLNISLSPNPVKEKFTIYNLRFTIGRIEIYNVLGQAFDKSEIVNRKSEIELDVSSLPPGIYFVHCIPIESGEQRRWTGKFIKE